MHYLDSYAWWCISNWRSTYIYTYTHIHIYKYICPCLFKLSTPTKLSNDKRTLFCGSSKCFFCGTSLVAQMVKRLSTMQETRVWALGWEDPLEKEMAIHSSTIAWKIPWTEEPGRLESMGSQRVRHDWETSLSKGLGKTLIPFSLVSFSLVSDETSD